MYAEQHNHDLQPTSKKPKGSATHKHIDSDSDSDSVDVAHTQTHHDNHFPSLAGQYDSRPAKRKGTA